MPRVAFLFAVVLLCLGCARDHVGPIRPSFFGHSDALSPADREAILTIARSRAPVLLPGARVISVKVFRGGTEVYATFERGVNGPTGGFTLEKLEGKWRITIENKPANRPNQAMQLTAGSVAIYT
jgi:hypothetical protein